MSIYALIYIAVINILAVILTARDKNSARKSVRRVKERTLLTLKQIEKIETKLHTLLVGYRGVILSEQDEKNLRATAMASAKLSEKNKMLTNALNAAYKVIKEIIQSVLILKYRFTEPNTPPCENLSEPQQNLIEARSHTQFRKRFF